MIHFTIESIQRRMEDHGSHYWEPATMRFFKSRVNYPAYSVAERESAYLVTSERFTSPHGDGERLFTVRYYEPSYSEAGLETVGVFNVLSRSVAHRRARFMAENRCIVPYCHVPMTISPRSIFGVFDSDERNRLRRLAGTCGNHPEFDWSE